MILEINMSKIVIFTLIESLQLPNICATIHAESDLFLNYSP